MDNTPKIVIIANNASEYLRMLLIELNGLGICPVCVFLGSSTEQWRFKLKSLERIFKLHGPLEVIKRIRDRSKDRVLESELDRIASYKDLYNELGFEERPYHHIKSGQLMVDLLEIEPDLILLGGCGIVDKILLSIPKKGTLNGHPALLPGVRGVDVIEWSLINKLPLGVTAHFAVPKVDSGDIILRYEVKPNPGEKIGNFIARMLSEQAKCLAKATLSVLKGDFTPIPNEASSAIFLATTSQQREIARLNYEELNK